jgi:biopolymer transport protein ExbD
MRRKRTRRERKPAELMLVPMIDIFTVLVTFLLMTAVFSRITILELDLPSSASAGATAPAFRLEVIVRKQGLELTNGTDLIATIPNVDGAYDLKRLSELAMSLKRDYPDTDDASVLLEPQIEYDHLIQVMDAIRSASVPAADEPNAPDQEPIDPSPTRLALFTDIAVGDAP